MIKTKKVNIIEVQDWDELVQDAYKRPYSFQQQDGCKERGSYDFELPNKWGAEDFQNTEIPIEVNGEEMGVSFKTWLERDVNEKFFPEGYDWEDSMFWQRNFYPSVDMIIDDLYQKGLIEDGEYSIKIDW